MQTIPQILAKELGKPQQAVENVIALLDQGNTIPFIARYRKEQHGSMDDTTLRKLAIKGMVLPSSSRAMTFSTYCTGCASSVAKICAIVCMIAPFRKLCPRTARAQTPICDTGS